MANPADVETFIERRRGSRVPVTVRINYATVDSMFTEFTRNVNEGGVFIHTDDPLEVGEAVALQFTLPGTESPIKGCGRVVRSEPNGMAIEFDELEASARATIDALVGDLRNGPNPE